MSRPSGDFCRKRARNPPAVSHRPGKLIDEPSAHEKLRLAVDHMDRLIDLKCEKVALLEMRSHMAWYIKGLEGATHVKRMITTVKTREEMIDIVNRYEAYLNGDKSARLVMEE